ncbi:hypothetical protein NQZ79_g5438 [Umbelopsis isabellina]|nr:hypothetical protein NQZ79_g5438 [Umbelopsis isabellina]
MFSSRKSVIGRPPTASTATSLSAASPRQIATKTYNLACKKLDRDEKKSKPNYNIRERLLLYRTMVHAEEVLQKRTRRTIRRVMDAEEDEESFTLGSTAPPTLLGTPAKLVWSTIDDEGVDPDQKLSEEPLHETPVVPFSERRRTVPTSIKPEKPRERMPTLPITIREEANRPLYRRDCNAATRTSLMPDTKPKAPVFAQ